MTALGDLTVPKVEQSGPPDTAEFTYVDIGSVDNKSKRIINSARLTVDDAPSRARQRLKAGDVLVSMTRPNLNAVAIVPSELDGAIGSTGFHVLRAKAEVLPQWLYYGVQSRAFVESMSRVVQGALYPAVRPRDIQAFELPTPEVTVQRRIVAEIEKQFSRLDEAVANLQRVKANVGRYAGSVLRDAVRGRLVATEADLARAAGVHYKTGMDLLSRVLSSRRALWSGRGRCPEPESVDTTELAELPEGWIWASAEQLSDFITKGTTPSASMMTDAAGDVQFLKVYNLTFDGSLNQNYRPTFVSRQTHEVELARSKVRPGDVLLNIVGPPLGQVSVVPSHLPEANINQAIARIRPVEPLIPRFVAIALMCDDIMGWATRRAKTTVGQSNLTLELCRALPLPLPPLAEQARIVAEVDRRLSIVREVEAEVDANLKRAQALRQAVLAKAFALSNS